MNHVALLPIIAIIGAFALVAIMTMVNKRPEKRVGGSKNGAPPAISQNYRRWRAMIFTVPPEQVDRSASKADDVYGVILDVGMVDRQTSVPFAISITAFPTGEASFHPTPGSSIVGLGNHPPIAQVARQIVQAAQGLRQATSPTRDRGLPRPGFARFFFLTAGGVRLSEGPLSAIQTPDHPFGALLHQFSRIRGFAEQQVDKRRANTEERT